MMDGTQWSARTVNDPLLGAAAERRRKEVRGTASTTPAGKAMFQMMGVPFITFVLQVG